MRRAMTLLEIVVTMAVAGILAVGTFKALEALYIRSAKARAVTELSIRSQIVLDQLSSMLSYRLPGSVAGYDGTVFGALDALSNPMPVLEWIGTLEEAYMLRAYSSFIDLNASDPATDTLVSPDTDGNGVATLMRQKFNLAPGYDVYGNRALMLGFAGSLDEGIFGTFATTFGWHGSNAEELYPVDIDGSGNMVLTGSPTFVYEKYYLADSGYAVARGESVSALLSQCGTDFSMIASADLNNTLFLFDGFRPWLGETFCADNNGVPAGRVVVLAGGVIGFRVDQMGSVIRLSLDMLRAMRGSNAVHISKQKAVF